MPAYTVVEANTAGKSSESPGRATDTCCMSCSLQRTFASSITPMSTPSELFLELVTAEALFLEASSNGVILVLSNRAPPLA